MNCIVSREVSWFPKASEECDSDVFVCLTMLNIIELSGIWEIVAAAHRRCLTFNVTGNPFCTLRWVIRFLKLGDLAEIWLHNHV